MTNQNTKKNHDQQQTSNQPNKQRYKTDQFHPNPSVPSNAAEQNFLIDPATEVQLEQNSKHGRLKYEGGKHRTHPRKPTSNCDPNTGRPLSRTQGTPIITAHRDRATDYHHTYNGDQDDLQNDAETMDGKRNKGCPIHRHTRCVKCPKVISMYNEM